MAKTPKKSKPEKPEDIETEPDAWERFEKTIGKIVPPKWRKVEDHLQPKQGSKVKS